jgi:hypothetical protein
MSNKGFPLPIKYLRWLALIIARQRSFVFQAPTEDEKIKPTGKNWLQAFYKRHPELSPNLPNRNLPTFRVWTPRSQKKLKLTGSCSSHCYFTTRSWPGLVLNISARSLATTLTAEPQPHSVMPCRNIDTVDVHTALPCMNSIRVKNKGGDQLMLVSNKP